MARITGEIDTHRPVEDVFDFVADERNEPRCNPKMRGVEIVSDAPIGAGTHFRAETVSMGRAVPMIIELTEFHRPTRLASTTQMDSMDLRGTLRFTRVPAGTRTGWTWDIEPRGLLKAMSLVAGWMGRRQDQERRIWTGLKHLVGGSAPLPAGRRFGAHGGAS